MKHAQFEERLAIYRDLQGAERERVDEHLRECAQCAARLQNYQAMDRGLANLAPLQPDRRLRERFYTALGDNVQVKKRTHAPSGRLFGAMSQVAGAVAIIVVIVALWAVFQAMNNSGLNPAGRATPISGPTSTLTTEEVRGRLTASSGQAFDYTLSMPANWKGKYGIEQYADRVTINYFHPTGKIAPTSGPILFGISVRTLAEWEVDQKGPHGIGLLTRDGVVFVENIGLDNPLNGTEAEEFQQMAGQVKDIVRTFTVAPAPPGPPTLPPNAPTLAPTRTATRSAFGIPAGCIAPDSTTTTYVNADDGYCLRYPSQYQIAETRDSHLVNLSRLYGAGAGVTITLTISTRPANGQTLEQVVAAELAAYPSDAAKQVTQIPDVLGGQPAVILQPGMIVDGLRRNRQAIVVYNDRIYHLTLSPYPATVESADPAAQIEKDTLWQTVIQSLSFMTPGTPTAQTVPQLGGTIVPATKPAPTSVPPTPPAGAAARGRLAYLVQTPPAKAPVHVLDLAGQGKWSFGNAPLTPLGWSPSGQYLLVLESDNQYAVYRYDGTLSGRYSALAQPFWAPLDALPGARDWLALEDSNGSLQAIQFPGGETGEVLTKNLGKQLPDRVIWSRDGWLAWTPNVDGIAQKGSKAQPLYIRRVDDANSAQSWKISADATQAYYYPIDWVPGTRYILAAKGAICNSCWGWGLPLVRIDADTGEIRDLGAAMLLTHEAYDWNPTQPGVLALAVGGSRYLFDEHRLVILDVKNASLQYLTDPGTSAFEPAWFPDGKFLAYAQVPASPNASGDGQTLERTLEGRIIITVDPAKRIFAPLTRPGQAIDGWPHWSADGKYLLYARKHDGVTDVHLVNWDDAQDQSLVSGLAAPVCNYGGCGWSSMLEYSALPK